jgi:hypothetical protein
MSRISNFLIFCSGADKSVLELCPTEKTKYHGIGSTVFLTSLLAILSGGYAIYFTFQSVFISVLLGSFWGLVIFSLDRYIVSSIKKTGKPRQELLMALPRILMALVLAITISKPLELRLFQDAVNKAMGEIADASISNCEKEWNITRDNLAKNKNSLESTRKQKTEEIFNNDGVYKSFTEEQSILKKSNESLEDRITENNKIINRGTTYRPVYDDFGKKLYTKRIFSKSALNALNTNKNLRSELTKNKTKINDLENEKTTRKDTLKLQVATIEQQYSKQIGGVQEQIDNHNSKRVGFLSDCTMRAKNAQDIPARLEALSKITSDSSSINLASWLITFLFILLETAPVVVKLLSSRGIYDETLERIEHEHIMNQKIIISNLNDSINTIVKISTEKNKNKLDAELKANAELLNEIASAQSEIAKLAVQKWKEQEIEKLENGFNSNINNSTNI